MSNLDDQIKIEAESLCKLVKDFFDLGSYPVVPSEFDAILTVVSRLENLLVESSNQTTERISDKEIQQIIDESNGKP